MLDAVLFSLWLVIAFVAVVIVILNPGKGLVKKSWKEILQIIIYVLIGFHLMLVGAAIYGLGVLVVYGKKEAIDALRNIA